MLGELLAADYLIRKNYRIIERNYRCRYGEIDIIASEGSNLVFLEVKSRSSDSYGHPGESVDREKIMRIRRTATCYLGSVDGIFFDSIRFDLVCLELAEKIPVDIMRNLNACPGRVHYEIKNVPEFDYCRNNQLLSRLQKFIKINHIKNAL
ncbi:MAG: YraN family protein [Actinobacteria bacterium]|nr:YraN family protein [Actinomycetota bacterium]